MFIPVPIIIGFAIVAVVCVWYIALTPDPKARKAWQEMRAFEKAMKAQMKERKKLEKQLRLEPSNNMTGDELIRLAKSKGLQTWAYENTFED